MVKHSFFVYFLCALSLFGCQKTNSISRQAIAPMTSNIMPQQDDDLGNNISNKDNYAEDIVISDEPVNIVNNILQNPTKNIHIGIVAPMTGKYASVGNILSETALLTTSNSAYANSGIVNIYNIGQLKGKDWKEDKEVKRLLEDNNDVIIGSIFADTTKKLLSILPQDRPFISFINTNTLTKEYPNLIVASMNDSYKIVSMLQYLKDNNRKFLSLVLPATNKGYEIDKMIRKISPQFSIFVITTQFYQAGSKKSITAATRGTKNRFVATYFIDENGQLYTETYKDNKKKNSQKIQQLSTTMTKQKEVETNAIYIEAEEGDLLLALSNLERYGILNRDIQILSNAVFDVNSSELTKLDNVLFIGYNYRFIDYFNKQFLSSFGHLPNYFAYLTYDILTMLGYMINTSSLSPISFYSSDGYRGVLDEFRFTREGEIERRMGIYGLNNQNIVKIYVPDDYISQNLIELKQQEYDKQHNIQK